MHNTYGDRHAYLVHPDEQGRGHRDKAMYVSPFHGTDGTYDSPRRSRSDRLDIAVTLDHRRRRRTFTASLSGRSVAAHADSGRRPAALRGSALIRMHGIWLWLRRLPVQPRPPTTRKVSR